MITDNNYFSKQLSDIHEELYYYSGELKRLKKSPIFDFGIENIKGEYSSLFLSFPFTIEEASVDCGISIHTSEIFDLYFEIGENNLDLSFDRIQKSKQLFKDPKLYSVDKFKVHDFIEDYFHSLTYQYQEFLRNAKEFHFFQGIESEEVILTGLLNLYQEAINTPNIQLQIIWGVRLTKSISDKVTNMLIDFIHQRLTLINPTIKTDNFESKIFVQRSISSSVEWLGNQQNLCELFFELEAKGWIRKIEDGERKNISTSITTLFDISGTKKNKTSDSNKSFYQQFKGENIKGSRILPFLESNKYKTNFNEIIKNNR